MIKNVVLLVVEKLKALEYGSYIRLLNILYIYSCSCPSPEDLLKKIVNNVTCQDFRFVIFS